MSVCDAVPNMEKGKEHKQSQERRAKTVEQQVRLAGSYPAQVRRCKVTCRWLVTSFQCHRARHWKSAGKPLKDRTELGFPEQRARLCVNRAAYIYLTT